MHIAFLINGLSGHIICSLSVKISEQSFCEVLPGKMMPLHGYLRPHLQSWASGAHLWLGCRVESKRLVADKGKLVEIIERSGAVPNGTGFALTVGPAPELDGKFLIVGRIVDGYEVVQELSMLPVVKDNSSSPFFKAGKALGDKRAIVAEQGFNKPFNKVVVSSSGVM
jgi:hypothetical protein